MTRAEVIETLESAPGGSMGLSRVIAKAVGWINRGNSRKGEWFAPEDTRDGKPLLDSLRGTDVHREPPDFSRSIDAALTLVPEGCAWEMANRINFQCDATVYGQDIFAGVEGMATPAIALCIAALKAQEKVGGWEEGE